MLLVVGCAAGAQSSGAGASGSAAAASSAASPEAAKQSAGAFDPKADEVLGTVVDRAAVLHSKHLGYPVNEDLQLEGFYEWYRDKGLDRVMLNNAGDPNEDPETNHGALEVEREVIRSFAPLYGFDPDDVWGLVSASGTDGNDRGIYFGRHYLT